MFCQFYFKSFIIIFKDKSLINEKNQEIGNNCFGGSKRLGLILNDQLKAFSINLNAENVNGMTHFDLAIHCRN